MAQIKSAKAVLKLSKAVFTLLIMVTNAVTVFIASILPNYLSQNLAIPTIVFIEVVANALIMFFGTEKQSAPGP